MNVRPKVKPPDLKASRGVQRSPCRRHAADHCGGVAIAPAELVFPDWDLRRETAANRQPETVYWRALTAENSPNKSFDRRGAEGLRLFRSDISARYAR